VLFGYLLLVVSCVLLVITGVSLGCLFFIVIGIWQIGGVWRSAKREGGFWAGKYNASIGAILLLFMNNFTNTVKELHRPAIEHRPASSTPAAPPLMPADNKPAANTQPSKQGGEWEVRYDYLGSGDGPPSGGFMARAYRNSARRISVRGANCNI